MKIIRQSFLIKPNFKIRNHYFPTTGLYLKSKTENLNEKRQKTLIKIRPINLRKVKVPPISDSLKQEIKGSLIKWKPGTKLDSQVFRALDCNTGKIFAVKMASFDKRKIDLLLRLKHKNIVEYYGYDILSSDKCHLYMEYIAGGKSLSFFL